MNLCQHEHADSDMTESMFRCTVVAGRTWTSENRHSQSESVPGLSRCDDTHPGLEESANGACGHRDHRAVVENQPVLDKDAYE